MQNAMAGSGMACLSMDRIRPGTWLSEGSAVSLSQNTTGSRSRLVTVWRSSVFFSDSTNGSPPSSSPLA
jgi:hypothetical protein